MQEFKAFRNEIFVKDKQSVKFTPEHLIIF